MAEKRPPSIIGIFANELSRILAAYLHNPELESKRHPLNDRIAIKLMLTLNKKFYQRELLFRDYQQELIECPLFNGKIQRLNPEAVFYAQNLLSKRITIVSKQKARPSNLHLLLLMLCRYSVNSDWAGTRLKRKKIVVSIQDDFFKPIAKVLQQQCQRLTKINAVAKNYQEQYGAFQLFVKNNNTEVADEISLGDVLEAVPKPLKTEITQSPEWYSGLIERILSSLNEKYSLLRSLGLKPEQWEAELSVVKLRDLKQLKSKADDYLKNGSKKELYPAYRQAFRDLQHKQSKIAGFSEFEDFAQSKAGATLLKTEILNLNQHSYDDEALTFAETIATDESHSVEMEDELRKLLTNHEDEFKPTAAYFFEQVIILQRPLYPEKNDPGVLNDFALHQLAAKEKAFVGLSHKELAEKLEQKIKTLINKYLNQ